MKDWLVKIGFKLLGGNIAEKVLSWLPLNGRKTIVSALVLLASIVLAMATGQDWDARVMVEYVHGLLVQLPYQPVLSSPEIATLISACGTFLGLWHKVLKALKAIHEQEAKAIADSSASAGV